MENLAGHFDAQRIVRRELTRCGIPIVDAPELLKGEVSVSIAGELTTADGDVIRFERAWYYWRCNGPVALDIAAALYEDPIGGSDVRVRGMSGGGYPPTGPAVTCRLADGRKVLAASERAGFEKYDAIVPGWWSRYAFAPESVDLVEWTTAQGGRAFIDSYHIDSELGLYLFVQGVLRRPGRPLELL